MAHSQTQEGKKRPEDHIWDLLQWIVNDLMGPLMLENQIIVGADMERNLIDD